MAATGRAPAADHVWAVSVNHVVCVASGISGPVPHGGGDLPDVLTERAPQHQTSGKRTF